VAGWWGRDQAAFEETGLDWDAVITAGVGVGEECQGLYGVWDEFGGHGPHHIGIFGGLIYRDKTNTVTKGAGVVIDNDADLFWTFAMHAGRVYAAGGDQTAGAPDTVWYWDLNTANSATKVVFEASTGVGQIGAGYIFQKWNRLWINGMQGTTVTSNPMIGRYSALNDGTSWPVANTIGGTSAIGGLSAYGDEFSTGWGSYHDNRGDFLLFLTNKRLYSIVQTGDSYTPFKTNDVISTGCVSQRAFVDLGVDSGDAVYLSDKGIHSLRQSQIHGGRSDRYLSWKIRNTFKTINKTRLKYATGAYWKEQGIIIFAVPTGSNLYNDLLLIADVRDADSQDGLTADNIVWTIGRLTSATAGDHTAQVLIPSRDLSDEKPYIYGGNRNGGVFRFNISVYSDLGSPYQAHLRTRHDDYGAPYVTKIPGNMEVWVESAGDYSIIANWVYDLGRRTSFARSIDLSVDALTLPFTLDETAVFGSGINLQRKVLYGTGHGETIAHEFRHGGTNQPFWIARVAQQVGGLGDEIGDLDS
jgi:hypothetical protein